MLTIDQKAISFIEMKSNAVFLSQGSLVLHVEDRSGKASGRKLEDQRILKDIEY